MNSGRSDVCLRLPQRGVYNFRPHNNAECLGLVDPGNNEEVTDLHPSRGYDKSSSSVNLKSNILDGRRCYMLKALAAGRHLTAYPIDYILADASIKIK